MTTLFILLSIALLISTMLAGKVVMECAKNPLQQQLVGAGGVVTGALVIGGLACAPALAMQDAEQTATANDDSLDDLEFQINRRLTKSAQGARIELDDEDNPVAKVKYADNRPEWVEQAPVLKGELHTASVASNLHFRKAECNRTLRENVKKAVDDYINDYLGDGNAAMLLRYDYDYIEEHLLVPSEDDGYFEETVMVSFGPMNQTHARLEFDTDFRGELEKRWQQVLATSRLLTVGLGSAGVLGLLSIAFGYLRLDTATKGYYTGRLQFLAAVAILSLIAAGALFVRLNGDWLRWF